MRADSELAASCTYYTIYKFLFSFDPFLPPVILPHGHKFGVPGSINKHRSEATLT